MSFIETPRFPENISYGASGGAEFRTDIAAVSSGFEQRNVAWSAARASYDVSHANRSAADIATLNTFFRAVKGRAHGFRFKDWADYTVSSGEGILDAGVGDGYPTYQLVKQYVAGALTDLRDIKKPVSGSVVISRNGSPATEGVAAGNYSLDTTTGIVTFVADSTKSIDANVTKTISSITKAANAVVTTSAAHGFVTGDKIKLTSVGGMTQVNNLYFTITYIDATSFYLNVDSSAYSVYTSGGSAIKYGITQTNLVRVNSAAHGLTNGKVVYISGVAGMTEVNSLAFTVANASTDYFELTGTNGSAYTAFTSGGTLSLFPQPADTLTFTGEFDVPCRFDVDKIAIDLIAPSINGWNQIPIVEVRV